MNAFIASPRVLREYCLREGQQIIARQELRRSGPYATSSGAGLSTMTCKKEVASASPSPAIDEDEEEKEETIKFKILLLLFEEEEEEDSIIKARSQIGSIFANAFESVG
jgi:hypothetical protein